MFMLTHTWILKNFLGLDFRNNLDFYIYNICPDLLPIHNCITSEFTHGIPRISHYPPEHRKAAFVLFHLLVDDIAHHGHINIEPVSGFNPDSKGYAYLRGQTLISPIIDFHRGIGMEINYNKAVYIAHTIIELSFDLRLSQDIGQGELFDLFNDAINHTLEKKMDELCGTLFWLFGIEAVKIRHTIEKGLNSFAFDRMKRLQNIEGRIEFYINRFGLDIEDDYIWQGVRTLLLKGLQLIGNNDDFLYPTLEAIKSSGFSYDL